MSPLCVHCFSVQTSAQRSMSARIGTSRAASSGELTANGKLDPVDTVRVVVVEDSGGLVEGADGGDGVERYSSGAPCCQQSQTALIAPT